MAFAVLEDMASSVEVVIFPSTFAECSHILDQDDAVIILGQVLILNGQGHDSKSTVLIQLINLPLALANLRFVMATRQLALLMAFWYLTKSNLQERNP